MLDPKDVATKMHAIEDNISGETGQDAPSLSRVIAVLLRIDETGMHAVLAEEINRAQTLMRTWYAKHGVTPSAESLAGLAFVQGVTFAVAAQRAHADEQQTS